MTKLFKRLVRELPGSDGVAENDVHGFILRDKGDRRSHIAMPWRVARAMYDQWEAQQPRQFQLNGPRRKGVFGRVKRGS